MSGGKPKPPTEPVADPAALASNLVRIAGHSHEMVAEFLRRQVANGWLGSGDPLAVGGAFLELTARLMTEPQRIVAAQMSLWRDHMKLWGSTTRRFWGYGEPEAPPQTSGEDDRIVDFFKQSYLMTARWAQRTLAGLDRLDPALAHKIDFYTRQFADLTAPGQLLAENPEVMHATLQSSGENLVAGLGHLLGQLERVTAAMARPGMPRPSPARLAAERIGVDVATTPGKVIFQNPLMQLIQYAPRSKRVRKRPLLMVAPWLNKFYIFDLRPENSLIRWIVEQGYTVFAISWVDPEGALAEKGFDDYVNDGIIAALDAIEEATRQAEVTVLGFGLGGTMTAAALGYLAAVRDRRVKAATLLSTVTDFSESGPLSVFVDEEHLGQIERLVRDGGPDARKSMTATFNLLRANDLIWSTVLEQYVAGARPFPFDLFLWTADATRLPRTLHRFYLEQLYRENLLVKPDGISLHGVPIDLSGIDLPIYLQASRDDQIAPWRTVFATTQLFGGPTRFVLSSSGHHAGVLAAPDDNAVAGYAVTEAPILREDELGAGDWLRQASWRQGSWWPDWEKWLAKQSGGWVAPRRPGGGRLKPIEDAPGSYVRAGAAE